MNPLRIAFFGSSLVSAYWNGAATYYRGIIRALALKGHRITFFEPDIYDRQAHRDIADPPWATVVVYKGHDERAVWNALEQAYDADILVKASGIGEFDSLLDRAVLQMKSRDTLVIFWDGDAPATLERLASDPADAFRPLVPQYDYIFTDGGGALVVDTYQRFGARHCEVIYNALDTEAHFSVPPQEQFAADLSLLANRLPDREARIEEFFLRPAEKLPYAAFLLGGNGWISKHLPRNVKYLGHIYTMQHNAFNCTPRAVLNVTRESMVRFGFSPPTRLFEAAGSAACIITDAWQGIDAFLEPGREVLVARNGDEVADLLSSLTSERGRAVGEAACRRIRSQHTYEHRAAQIEGLLAERFPSAKSLPTSSSAWQRV